MVMRSLVVIIVLLACGIAIVALRVEITREGYRLKRSDERRQAAGEEGRRLDAGINKIVTPAKARWMNEELKLDLRPPKRVTLPGESAEGARP